MWVKIAFESMRTLQSIQFMYFFGGGFNSRAIFGGGPIFYPLAINSKFYLTRAFYRVVSQQHRTITGVQIDIIGEGMHTATAIRPNHVAELFVV